MPRAFLFDDSGGLVYHWRALRYRRRLWADFVRQVEHWLADWNPPQREIVIVGPSAGYTLPRTFLERFDRVTILEPDPLARWLLRCRFRGIPFVAGCLDCLNHLHGPSLLARTYPDAAILFSNVIGQKLRALPGGWMNQLNKALEGHSWASYHDIVSTRQHPARQEPLDIDSQPDLETVLATFWGSGVLEVYDHGTYDAIASTAFATWQITADQCQLVGWRSIIVVASSNVIPGNSGMGGRS